MFGIRISLSDEFSSGMYRESDRRGGSISALNCTVDVIEAAGFTFKQALLLVNEVLPRRELNTIYQENCFRITREQILSVAEKYNIEII